MIYCKDCKRQFGLDSAIEVKLKKDNFWFTSIVGRFGCEFCASSDKETYYSAWHLISDIVARLKGKEEINIATKLEQDKLEIEKRKLDQEDRRLNLLEKQAKSATA